MLNFTYAGSNLSIYTASRPERQICDTDLHDNIFFSTISSYLQTLQRLQEYGNLTNDLTEDFTQSYNVDASSTGNHREVLVRYTLRTSSYNTPVWHPVMNFDFAAY